MTNWSSPPPDPIVGAAVGGDGVETVVSLSVVVMTTSSEFVVVRVRVMTYVDGCVE
jgi:hypothetical protein